MSRKDDKKKARQRKREAFKQQQRREGEEKEGRRLARIARHFGESVGYTAHLHGDPVAIFCKGEAAYVLPGAELMHATMVEVGADPNEYSLFDTCLEHMLRGIGLGLPYVLHRQVHDDLVRLAGLSALDGSVFVGDFVEIRGGWKAVRPLVWRDGSEPA